MSKSQSPEVPLLFRLDPAWFVHLLSEWLDMKSLGMLDTAVYSREFRPQFLNSLRSMRSKTVDNVGEEKCSRKLFDHRKLLWSSQITNTDLRIDHDEWSGWWFRWLSLRQICIESVKKLHYTGSCSDTMSRVLELPAFANANDWDVRVVLTTLQHSCPLLEYLKLSWIYSDTGMQFSHNLLKTSRSYASWYSTAVNFQMQTYIASPAWTILLA